MGIIALVGGDEFRPACEAMDRALLSMIPRDIPHVVIIPTAAARQGPLLAAKNGERWFTRLGAHASSLMVVSEIEASDPVFCARLDTADIIYLTGGDPSLLLRILKGSAFTEAMRRRLRDNVMLAGSSAGAMVLSAVMRSGAPAWTPALDFAHHITVLPHHDDASRTSVEIARAGLSGTLSGITPVGIPTATACVSADGAPEWRVLGAQPVTVYAANGSRQIKPGGHFTL